MDDDELRDLQDPENWDYDSAEVMPAVTDPHAAVVVAFAGQDFDRVAKQAAEACMKLSEFIREAALAKVAQQSLRSA